MKRYVMSRDSAGRARCLVAVSGESIGPLPHLVQHSPDGFEWGYGGSGPSDLARSIVGDVLDDPDPSPRIYQAVKRKLVARIPMDGGEITSDEVNFVILEVLEP